MPPSNDHGRALECIFSNKVKQHVENKGIIFSFTKRAASDNVRDQATVNSMPSRMKQDFDTFSDTFLEWADEQEWFKEATQVTLDRFPDAAGVHGSVTDIKLDIEKKVGALTTKEISLKHNHDALKHPRLPRLPEQCGLSNPKIKEDYTIKHDRIWSEFYAAAQKLCHGSTKFSELKKNDPGFIDNGLYVPLLNLVKTFLEAHANNAQHAPIFFDFLTSQSNHLVLKNEPAHVLIKHFDNITKPRNFHITYPYANKKTTMLINFDNGWQLTFRLHNASSEFFRNGKLQKSVKLDVQCINIELVVGTERLLK